MMIKDLGTFCVVVGLATPAAANEEELRELVENMVGKTAFVHVQKAEDWSHCVDDIPKARDVPSDHIGPVCNAEFRYVTPRNQFSATATNGDDIGQFERVEGTYYPLNLGVHSRIMVMAINEIGLPNCEWHVQYRSWIDQRNGIFHAITGGAFVDGLFQDGCFVQTEGKWQVKYNLAVIE